MEYYYYNIIMFGVG